MKTVSVSIENLCVPCHCGCRHCLLSSRHCSTGVDYRRSQRFTSRFYGWLKEKRLDLNGLFYVGYCNDFPELEEHSSFVQKYSPQFDFLQFNGLAFRSREKLDELLVSIINRNVHLIDLTFYGTREYHDRFAGRKGDFDYLLLILEEANRLELPVGISVALTQENASQMEELFEILMEYEVHRYSVFLPHAKGRGMDLSDNRLTRNDYERLPQIVKDNMVRVPHLTEQEWIQRNIWPEAYRRALTISLTPENIERLESMDPAEIIQELEAADDAYYGAIPTASELANLVGRPDNQQIFRLRDLYLQWQKRYLQAHPIHVPDMNEERYSFSTRIYHEKV